MSGSTWRAHWATTGSCRAGSTMPTGSKICWRVARPATTAWRGASCCTGPRSRCGGVAIFRSAGEGRWLAYGLALLGRVRTGQERPAEARLLLEEALRVWSGLEATYGQRFDSYLHYYLGLNALSERDSDTARAEFEASLAGLEEGGDDM